MTTLKDLYNALIGKFSLKLQAKWDQSGIHRFSLWNKKINKILLCLDCNEEVINLAIKFKYYVIISHHPIFVNSNEIENQCNTNSMLNKLKKHKINLISLHTCVDNNEYGLNLYLIKMLKLNNILCIKNPNTDTLYYIGCFKKPLKFNNAINFINKTFKTNNIKFLKETNIIDSIILSCGSGFSVLKSDLKNFSKSSLIITGDIKWHDWILLDDLKINAIDVGHDLEKYFINLVNDILISKFPKLKIIKHYPTIELMSLSNTKSL